MWIMIRIRMTSARTLRQLSYISLASSSLYSLLFNFQSQHWTWREQRSISRVVYIKTPKGWTKSLFIVWQRKTYAYGLVESGRMWQLVLQDWIASMILLGVAALPQLFIQLDNESNITPEIAKVVDDFLIFGPRKTIEDFYAAMGSRFKIRRLLIDQ